MMSILRSVRPQAWGALALSLVILLLGVAGHGMRTDVERLDRVLRQEQVLREQMERVAREQAWLQRQLSRRLDTPSAILEAYAPGARIEVREKEPEVLTDTLRLRRVELALDGISWETLRGLVQAFEGQSPPWRLVSLETSSGLTGLEGVLRFEGMEAGGER